MMELISSKRKFVPSLTPGRFLFACSDPGHIKYSDDGYTIVDVTPAALSGLSVTAIAANGDDVVVFTSASRVFYSHDRGTTFTESASSPVSGIKFGTAVGPGEFVAWTEGGGIGSVYSTDNGETWTVGGSIGPGSMAPNDIVGGVMGTDHCVVFVAGNAGGGLYTSTDLGVSWTNQSSSSFNACGFNGSRFFAVNTRIYDSTDLTTWNLKAGLIGGHDAESISMESTWGLVGTFAGEIYRITDDGDTTSLILTTSARYYTAETYDTLGFIGPGGGGTNDHRYTNDSGVTVGAVTAFSELETTMSRYDR